jgi:hypothetical protein
MPASFCRLALVVLLLAGGCSLGAAAQGQEIPRQPSSQLPAAVLPSVIRGVEVLARGPVHEAFATPTTDPIPTKPIPKVPPKALEELPPAEKPEGDTVWISGYWAWDEERNDFLWVSGIWRTPPPGQHWVAGYWGPDGPQWHWVPGFWSPGAMQESSVQTITYLPPPPAPREIANPGPPPTQESFYVPGHWVWQEARSSTVGGARVWQGTGFVWKAGYGARMQPGYIWIPTHYRWTPGGCIFIPGYWDLPLADRGVLYAPVVVDRAVVGKTFIYTPAYAVRSTLVIDALFVRPNSCHYYFGDYYGPMYRELGFESVVTYGRRRYDALFVSERYRHRSDPHWEQAQLDLCLARHAGRAPCPPRTVAQSDRASVPSVNTVHHVNNSNRAPGNSLQLLIPTAELAADTGIHTMPLDKAARTQAKQQAQAIHQVGLQRRQIEVKAPIDALIRPRAATLQVPAGQPLALHSAPAPDMRSSDAAKQAAVDRPARSATTIGPSRPAAPALPSQPIPEGKPPSTEQPAPPGAAPRFQRLPSPGLPSTSPAPFQRLTPSSQPQPQPTPEQQQRPS